jgi:hypothetical protein
VPTDLEDPRCTTALARNERYVREFVELFELCPYARRCRENRRLQRTVLLEPGGAPESPGFELAASAIAGAVAQFEGLPHDSIDVGLIILPALVPALANGLAAARAFERLVSAVRERVQARHGNAGAPFYCVAFHPDFAEDLATEHRAVRFIRRSPDPTVQIVRATVLNAVRGSDPAREPLPVSERIARANLTKLKEHGPQRLRELLAEIRGQDR